MSNRIRRTKEDKRRAKVKALLSALEAELEKAIASCEDGRVYTVTSSTTVISGGIAETEVNSRNRIVLR